MNTENADTAQWLDVLVQKIRSAFGDRALFIGLQGSRGRGEARPDSDIDVVLVLDSLSIEDLKTYRALIGSMDGFEACGFVSSRAVISEWPKHEIFQFYHDTRPLHGSLDNLIPSFDRDDVLQSVRIGAANIYHEACHRYLYDGGDPGDLRGAYKAAFFVLQALYYAEHRKYVRTARELLDLLAGEGREVLDTFLRWDALADERARSPERCFERLIDWCAGLLESM